MNLQNYSASRNAGSTILIAFDVAVEDINQSYRRALKNYSEHVTLPGFRKGKAPLKMIEEQDRHRVRVIDMAEEDILRAALREAVKKEEFIPQNVLSHRVEKKSDFSLTEPMHIEFRFDYVTPFQAKDYKGIKIVKKAPHVSDEVVEEQLEKIAMQHANLVPVDRAAAEGDTIFVDFSGFGEDGAAIAGASGQNMQIVLGSKRFIPGFEEALVGAKAGDEREFTVRFPDDYATIELRNVLALFKTKIHAVKEQKIPAIDDDFAKDLNFDSLELLKNEIRERQKGETERELVEEMEADLLENLRKANPLSELPQILVDDEINRRQQSFKRMLAQVRLTPDQYFEATKSTREDLEASMDKMARETVHSSLILRAVADAEKIGVTTEDLSRAITYAAHNADQSPQVFADRLREEGNLDAVKFDILKRKSLQFILKNAEVEEALVPQLASASS